jgi:Fe(3+) dicitrate transport protein
VQTSASYPFKLFGLRHEILGGLRLHRDWARRLHTEDGHNMIERQLVPDGAMRTTRDATGYARALASFVRDKISVGPVEISAGVRFELIRTEWVDRAEPEASNHDLHSVWIPGVGVFYQALPWLGFLGGVHKGFVPGAPAPEGTADPEESINYEAGVRLQHKDLRFDAIGFWNDYQNLKGSCTFSSGCMEGLIDSEFAGGSVDVYGVEAHAAGSLWRGRRIAIPVAGSYTFTRSQFRTGFRSQNPQWGTVEPGDELPYLPSHQVAVTLGAKHEYVDLFLTGRYTGAMRDVAGSGAIPPDVLVPASRSLDAATHVYAGKFGEFYLTATNLLDEASVVSLRPFGARPGAPRRFIFGYKNEF